MSLKVTGRHRILAVLIKSEMVNWSGCIAFIKSSSRDAVHEKSVEVNDWCKISFKGNHVMGRVHTEFIPDPTYINLIYE